MTTSRRCSIKEYFAYTTGCVVFVALFSYVNAELAVETDSIAIFLTSLAGLIVLAGPVLVGPIGFVVAGRRGFRMASWVGFAFSVLIFLALFVPGVPA